jgi:hypothetical protein
VKSEFSRFKVSLIQSFSLGGQLENLDNSNNLQSASFLAANSSAYGASK